ncbi:ABC transporter permease subunit [Aquibacillus albus]|uniref:ABC-2 type transport system permease protein n=1 Tax=Aquibacillus albus TaxID=1168171 RepID=A0ABS2MZ38_9BACI|nr:ABC transporter permease subunit [Aquibacillus albus]MBM7571111.1 ABC-2 type transport system permease protein [Aquibacillus albus]
MNMFWHEMKANQRSSLLWTLTLMVLISVFFSMFPTFSKEVDSLRKALEGFPDALLRSLNFDVNNFSSILGFYAYVFAYISLCGAIQASSLGIGILSKETREKTADFLLTKPVTRQQVITAKLCAAFSSILLTNIGFIVAATTMAHIVKNNPLNETIFFMISISLFFIQLIFLAVGALAATIISKIKSVLPYSLAIVFLFFIISMFASSTGDDKLRYLTPFQYFDALSIIKQEGYDLTFVLLSIVVIACSLTASYVLYLKKDIHAV